jgi:Ca2+-binding EF-hand superfamily protein
VGGGVAPGSSPVGGDASPNQKHLQAQLLADQQKEDDDNTLGVWVLSQEEEEKCRELFNALDKDRKGSLDLKKVKVLLHTLGHQVSSEKELQKIMARVDIENYGHITFG